MSVPIRILLAEHSDDDAAVVVHALRRAGYDPTVQRVHDRAQYLSALADDVDAIISDYSMPHFSCAAALALMKARGLDLPFIVVSGTIDEDAAVAILRAGAHDFVTKQNLARLGPALDRELLDARNRAERRRAERSLAHQRDFLRVVLDTNPGLIFVKDSGGRFTLANQAVADLYGTTVPDLIGKTDADFNPRLEEVVHSRAVEHQVISTGQSVLIGSELVTDPRTGAGRWFETRRVPLAVPDEVDRHVLSIASEITERKAAEDALRAREDQFRQSQKMEAVGQLAGGVAHDFNNLLTAILGYTALVSETVQDQPELLGDLEEIRKAGERAKALTQQLLTFSRKQMAQPSIVDLNGVVAQVEKMLHRVIGDDVVIVATKDAGLRPIKADPNQLEQILVNLAVNARDAMPRGGTLRIETKNDIMPEDEPESSGATFPCVTLVVADSGIGIPDAIRDRIFEPFFTTKGPGKGTGLGLSTVYGIVTQWGGTIAVESECDKGTTFVMRFPVVNRPIDAAGDPGQTVPYAGTETILLVEDEPGVRQLVQRVLCGRGYDVLEARDVRHALEISSSFPSEIHLLLSDIVMPVMSGPDLAQRIVAGRPDIRVLYMSGFANQLNTAHGAMSAGVTILHKPFSPDTLVRAVRDCLDVVVS
jgi:two-component system cell cycle sensor histidine kinase/response regulator CckA